MDLCEVCAKISAKYACPKCGVRTCCLECVNIHKKELNCDGVRDRTKFIYLKSFTELDFLSDYRMLEEASRFVYDKRQRKKNDRRFNCQTKELPLHLYRLKCAARKRGTVLLYLLENFTRRKANSTRLNYKLGKIFWKIEWIFLNSFPSSLKFSDAKCDETLRLGSVLSKYFNPKSEDETIKNNLAYYHSSGMIGCRILLRAEKIKCSGKKYYELDPRLSLKDNLAGKCIIEYPTIYVILKNHSYNFSIADSDDELIDCDDASNQHDEINSNINMESSDTCKSEDNNKIQKETFTSAFARQKKKLIENEIADSKKNEPKNYLFTSEYMSSDDEI